MLIMSFVRCSALGSSAPHRPAATNSPATTPRLTIHIGRIMVTILNYGCSVADPSGTLRAGPPTAVTLSCSPRLSGGRGRVWGGFVPAGSIPLPQIHPPRGARGFQKCGSVAASGSRSAFAASEAVRVTAVVQMAGVARARLDHGSDENQ